MSIFSEDDIQRAKSVDLYHFVKDNNICKYRDEGKYIRILDKYGKGQAITIKKGTNLYTFWGNGQESESHNAVTFMTDVLGYEFIDAVRALLGFDNMISVQAKEIGGTPKESEKPKELVFPEKEPGKPRRLYAYLNKTRGIDGKIIEKLLELGFIYQSVDGDIIFITKEKNCYEIRSTRSTGYQKKRCYSQTPGDFWYFNFGSSADIYVCEGAIDAISLCEIQKKPGLYVSLHSVSNTKRILTRLRQEHPQSTIYLCTDKDVDGENAAIHNIGLYDVRLTPKSKDWNEDLQKKYFWEVRKLE